MKTKYGAVFLFLICGILTLPCGVHAATKQTAAKSWKQVTKASWYGSDFHGRVSADGSRFDARTMTAAHRSLRMGSKVKVTDLRSGRSVIVKITDRGPYVQGRGIDLSYAAARALGILDRGVAQVRIETVSSKPAKPLPILIAAASEVSAAWPRAIVQ